MRQNKKINAPKQKDKHANGEDGITGWVCEWVFIEGDQIFRFDANFISWWQ